MFGGVIANLVPPRRVISGGSRAGCGVSVHEQKFGRGAEEKGDTGPEPDQDHADEQPGMQRRFGELGIMRRRSADIGLRRAALRKNVAQ
ncbi:MAG: hypothetical protein QOD74_940 [Variibacter sp.]|nr:hypothetical protein [Variibacter sp.]